MFLDKTNPTEHGKQILQLWHSSSSTGLTFQPVFKTRGKIMFISVYLQKNSKKIEKIKTTNYSLK